jgi:hypothetical protein
MSESGGRITRNMLKGSARNNGVVKEIFTKANRYPNKASSGQQGGGLWKKGKETVWMGTFECRRNIREETDTQPVLACQGKQQLILLPWSAIVQGFSCRPKDDRAVRMVVS